MDIATTSQPQQGNIDIVGRRRLWFSLSGLIFVIGLISMIASQILLGAPLRLGLDFSGGTLLEVEFAQPVTTAQVYTALQAEGVGSSVVQLDTSNNRDALIRTPPLSEEERVKTEAGLRERVGSFERRRVETVGPTVGASLLRTGIVAVLLSLGLIMVYVAFRFQTDYAVFAIVALVHDVVLTIGAFALLGLTTGMEVDSLFMVSLLTIIGFSINDTVVIYDRIRENLRLVSRRMPFADVVNLSVNQTFSRSINTTLTTMLALLSIFLFGGPTLKPFALALLIGFGLGAYSSIFIASPMLVWWRNRLRAKAISLAAEPEAADPEEV